MIEIDRIGLVATHACQQHAACFGLSEYAVDDLGRPVGVGAEIMRNATNCDSMGGTQGRTAVATYTVLIFAVDPIVLRVIDMDIVGALAHTHLARDAAVLVTFNSEFCGK